MISSKRYKAIISELLIAEERWLNNLARESIKLIEEAEAAAYDAEIHAQARAAEIVAEAKQRASSAHDEAVARAREMVNTARAHAGEAADALEKNSLQSSREAADRLRAEAADKLATAVDIVIADIIN